MVEAIRLRRGWKVTHRPKCAWEIFHNGEILGRQIVSDSVLDSRPRNQKELIVSILRRWEYLIIRESSEPNVQLIYTAEGDVDCEEVPFQALPMELGSLGSKGWELVRVVSLVIPSNDRLSEYYLKGPHDPERGLKN